MYQANGPCAKLMAPTCAESSELDEDVRRGLALHLLRPLKWFHVPHGGERPFHRKSTRLLELT